MHQAAGTLETFRTVQQELLLLGGSVLLGFPAGVLFDITRLCRKCIPHSAFLVALEDMLCLVLLSFLLLCYTSACAGGQFRVYFAVGCLAGFLFYYGTVGVLVLKCSDCLLRPVRWGWHRIVCISRKLKQNFVKYAEKRKRAGKKSQNRLQNHPYRMYNKTSEKTEESRKGS